MKLGRRNFRSLDVQKGLQGDGSDTRTFHLDPFGGRHRDQISCRVGQLYTLVTPLSLPESVPLRQYRSNPRPCRALVLVGLGWTATEFLSLGSKSSCSWQ